jgi:beta-glucosidase
MNLFYRNYLISIVLLWTGISFTLLAQYYSDSVSNVKSTDFSWPEGKKVAISLTFDDARLSQIDKGIPILDKYNVKGTFYVSPDNMIQRKNGWKNALEKGHEIGNHSLLHPCTGNFVWSRQRALEDYTLSGMAEELDSANQWIYAQLGTTPLSFAYPCGQTFIGRGKETRSYIPIIASLFETGRIWLSEAPNDPVYCDLAQLTGIELDGKSFEEIRKIISASEGKWLILAGHEMDEEGFQTSRLATLEELCRYALDPANGIWIDNVHNIASYIRVKRNEPAHVEMLPYLNPALPVEKRIDDLLARMTLEEKIGQLNMPCVYEDALGGTIEEKTVGCRKFAAGTLIDGIGPGGGFFTLSNTILHKGPVQQASYFNELQHIALEKTRLKIPLLQTEEGTHGLMCSGATIFPEGLALGSTWNTDLIREIYTTAAREARAVGIHELFTLVIEPNRDPRLGRNQEGYSEDPFLCSQIAKAIVSGIQGYDVSQGDKVIAGLCHYPGQSQPVSGLERGAMEISERTLREVFLPPWEAGIREKGALGVMATYPSIDGMPTHNSSKILTGILREELGFKGLVLSEGGGVQTNIYNGLTDNEKEAGAMAANAGMDVSISFQQGYFSEMIENVKEGRVSVQTIDRSVRRVLYVKYLLGLFDDPFVDPQKAAALSHTIQNQDLALKAAHEGIVLLKNDNFLLPLKKSIRSIAVIGPNANDERNQLGDYTSISILQDIVTVLEGIQGKLPQSAKINYVKGCRVIGDKDLDIDKAVKAAARSEIAVVVVGENDWQKPDQQGTDGEGYDVATLELTGHQQKLIERVYATGTPTIVVLINGRPLAIPWIKEHIPAIVEAWIPGEKGGVAVADILFGDYNPNGRLSISIPRHAGQLPVYYNYKPSKSYWIEQGWGKPYADLDPKPLFFFGHGLSYTSFEYSNLKITPDRTGTNGSVVVSVDVKNTGERAGAEVVQLYLHDRISSIVTPVIQLKGFNKIWFQPGEKKTTAFTLTTKELQLLDKNLIWTVEPGEFEVSVGSSSEDIHLRGNFSVY